jgi:hypothetical protein
VRDYRMTTLDGERIRHPPIVDGNKMVDMLLIGDLLKVVNSARQNVIEQLNSCIFS